MGSLARYRVHRQQEGFACAGIGEINRDDDSDTNTTDSLAKPYIHGDTIIIVYANTHADSLPLAGDNCS